MDPKDGLDLVNDVFTELCCQIATGSRLKTGTVCNGSGMGCGNQRRLRKHGFL